MTQVGCGCGGDAIGHRYGRGFVCGQSQLVPGSKIPVKGNPSDYFVAQHVLSNDSRERKDTPIFSGALMYFPLAFAALARVSKKGNDKHNPGQPLHWSREKSSDHLDCVARHLMDGGPDGTNMDDDGELHLTHGIWRLCAKVQLIEEARLGRAKS